MRTLLACCLILIGAAGAAAQVETTPPPAVGQEEYRIGPGDVLRIQVWGRPELTGPVTVDATGRIQLPLIGRVEVAERTPAELGEYLTERYLLVDPSTPAVLAAVAQYNSRSIAVVGEVHGPGRYPFRSIPGVWSVLLAAGGPTPNADLTRVEIVRGEESTDGPQSVTIDLSRGIQKTPAEELPALQPDDTIVVPSVIASAAPGSRIQVLGAVRTPGTFPVSAAETVTQAIALSGGFLPNADLRKIRLTRTTSRGIVSYQLDLQGFLYDGQPRADLPMQPGDTITVPREKSFMRSVLDGFLRLAPLVTAGVSLAWAASR
ncbi:MAG: polysaccharide biosynthesis/export family protein [Candidatus Eisenbacteria sp.]|nr:polysaccharide biosynthesis/export family protein [Candidatus Eisenbacteria bacterium]